jgi:glycosyltransferase involved in cell wall biosynthesis
MRFLIYGNSPRAGTGYGVQIAHLARGLKRDGHNVAVACTYGHQTGVGEWDSGHGPVTLYPSGWLENSVDVLALHALHWFGGDPKAGWIITLTDQWILNPVNLDDFQVVAWTPVDHWPLPPEVLKFFHKNRQARPVAMSKYGQQQMIEAGLAADYVPLAVNTTMFQHRDTVNTGSEETPIRELLAIPDTAKFVVAMVAMNKDPDDRKGFEAAFRAFGRFWREHQDAYLYVHADRYGIAGSQLNLIELAKHCAIPPHAIGFSNTWAMQIGFSIEMMAAIYSAADVLLCPSKGEGFGVPMIEAQACGTPVIATDFTAQSELVGAGWKVSGQLLFDAKQYASYLAANHGDVTDALMAAYKAQGDKKLTQDAIAFAADYDARLVYDTYWRPVIKSLEPYQPDANKPKMRLVDVIVPYLRESNRERLERSFNTTNDGSARLVIVQTEGDELRTYAQNVNAAVSCSSADWVCVVGDDVEFHPGWIEAARGLSDRYDVIGTNDSQPGRTRNPLVANGSHADHFFIRRTYIDDEGPSLDGPGICAPECYGHWYVDREIIELAKARKVFAPCLESVIEHHHPGYDGNEAARDADPVYAKAPVTADADLKTWMKRAPIVAGYRT